MVTMRIWSLDKLREPICKPICPILAIETFEQKEEREKWERYRDAVAKQWGLKDRLSVERIFVRAFSARTKEIFIEHEARRQAQIAAGLSDGDDGFLRVAEVDVERWLTPIFAKLLAILASMIGVLLEPVRWRDAVARYIQLAPRLVFLRLHI